MAEELPEIKVCKDSSEVEATGGGKYMTYGLSDDEALRNSYFQEKSEAILEHPLKTEFIVPKWENCKHWRFEYFCDIYLAAIAALIFFPFKLTLSIPHGQDISLYEHLNRSFPGTNWPTLIVNAIILAVCFTYTISVWSVQIKVIYMYLRIDRVVVWINLCMLAFITILPLALTSLELSISSYEPAFLCISTSAVGLCQTAHIIYSFIINYFEQTHDESHRISNVIVILLQIYSALCIPIRILLGLLLWFAPMIGNESLLIVFILCLFAPFDLLLIESIFFLIHRNVDGIASIVFYLKHFNKLLSKDRFMQFCDAFYVVLGVILIVEVLTVMNNDIYRFSIVSNYTKEYRLHDLLASNQNYLYSLVWGLIVIFSFWVTNFHMFSYIITLNRIIFYMEMLSHFFLCFIPSLALFAAEYSNRGNIRDLRLAILITLSIVISIGVVHFMIWAYIRFWAKHLHIATYLPQFTPPDEDSDSFDLAHNVGTTVLPEMNLFEARNALNLRLDKITTLRMFLLPIAVPSIAFVLLLAELINKNTVDVYIMFIVFLFAIPVLLVVDSIPNIFLYATRIRTYVKLYVKPRI